MAEQTIQMIQVVRRPTLCTPSFDGTTELEEFISQFERVASFMAWRNDEKLLRFQMAILGAAKKGLTSDTFDGICAQLRSRYCLSENGAVALLKTLKWKANDNVHEFAAYVRRLVDTAFRELTPDQREQRAIKELTNALPASCHTLTWELRNRTPASYEEVIDLIQGFNELTVNTKINRVEADEVSNLRKEVSAQAALIEQMVASQLEMQKQLSVAIEKLKPRRDNSSIVCYRCGKKGHISKHCRSAKDESENANVQ